MLCFIVFKRIHKLLEIMRAFRIDVEQKNNPKQSHFYIETIILKDDKIT